MTLDTQPKFEARLATSPADVQAAQRLRYDVFVRELGGDGPLVDHDRQLEQDEFDPHYDHLLLFDHARSQSPVIGAYRILTDTQMPVIGRYYSETEFDLSVLQSSGRRLMELGRSCLHPDYRGGMAMMHLWNGLSEYVIQNQIEVLFGVASFHGTNVDALAQPLAFLHHNHTAPADLSARAWPNVYQEMELLPVDQVDRKAATLLIPALIKAYLRLGGCVGQGAYLDHTFNTTDVCLIMDTAKMNARYRRLYEGRKPK